MNRFKSLYLINFVVIILSVKLANASVDQIKFKENHSHLGLDISWQDQTVILPNIRSSHRKSNYELNDANKIEILQNENGDEILFFDFWIKGNCGNRGFITYIHNNHLNLNYFTIDAKDKNLSLNPIDNIQKTDAIYQATCTSWKIIDNTIIQIAYAIDYIEICNIDNSRANWIYPPLFYQFTRFDNGTPQFKQLNKEDIFNNQHLYKAWENKFELMRSKPKNIVTKISNEFEIEFCKLLNTSKDVEKLYEALMKVPTKIKRNKSSQ